MLASPSPWERLVCKKGCQQALPFQSFVTIKLKGLHEMQVSEAGVLGHRDSNEITGTLRGCVGVLWRNYPVGLAANAPKSKNTHVMLQVPQFSGNVLVRLRTLVDVSRSSCRVQIWIGHPLTYRLSFVLVLPSCPLMD